MTPGASELDKHTVHHRDRLLFLFAVAGADPLLSLSYWGDLSLLHPEPSSSGQEGTASADPREPALTSSTGPHHQLGEAADALFLPEAFLLAAAASQIQGDEAAAAAGHPLALHAGTGECSAIAPEKGECKGSARGFGTSAEQLSAPCGCLFPFCMG